MMLAYNFCDIDMLFIEISKAEKDKITEKAVILFLDDLEYCLSNLDLIVETPTRYAYILHGQASKIYVLGSTGKISCSLTCIEIGNSLINLLYDHTHLFPSQLIDNHNWLTIMAFGFKYYLANKSFPDKLELLKFIGEAFRFTGYISFFSAQVAQSFPLPLKENITSSDSYAQVFDNICYGYEYNDQAAALCAADIKINGPTFWNLQNLGHYAYFKGMREQAAILYSTAAERLRNLKRLNTHYNRGVFHWPDSATCERLVNSSSDLPIEIYNTDCGVPEDRKIVHLAACDDSYFKRFGRGLIASSSRASAVIIHLHIHQPSMSTIRELREWANNPHVCVRHSFSFLPEAGPSFYTTLRYLVLPQLMQIYKLPFAITDMDVLINGSWERLLRRSADYQLGLVEWSQNEAITRPFRLPTVPWAVPAGFIYVARGGEAFANFMNSYLADRLREYAKESDQQYWTIDQVAIRLAMDNIAFKQNLRIYNLWSDPMINFAHSSDGRSKDSYFETFKNISPKEFC